jgi:hypothetical protein
MAREVFNVGNCNEMAYAAFVYLRNIDYPDFQIVKVAMWPEHDWHVFVVLGTLKGNPRLSDLPNDIVICDPWLARKVEIVFPGAPANYKKGVFATVPGYEPVVADYADVAKEAGVAWPKTEIEVMLSKPKT